MSKLAHSSDYMELIEERASPEIHVDFNIRDMTVAIANLVRESRDPATAFYVGANREALIDAHTQLGRMIDRLPVQREAAE